MRGSCIRHPAKEPLIIVREWQIEACDGNRCAAILLSFFEYWHDIKLQMASKAARQNSIAIAHGDSPTQDETLLQFHNEQELEAGILGFYGASSIRKAIALLKEKDFISVCSNPNSRYKFDQTRYFLFCDEQVNQWLENHCSADSLKVTDRDVKTTDGSFNLANESVKTTDDSFNLRNDLYTETTPEITSKITSEINTPLTPKGEEIAANQTSLFSGESQDQKTNPCQNSKSVNQDIPPCPPSPPPNLTEADFDRFWSVVKVKDSKTGKVGSRKKFLKVKGVSVETLIESRVVQQEWHEKNKGTLQYLSQPLRWLEDERWTDVMEPTPIAPQSDSLPTFQPQTNNATERFENQFKNPQRHVGLIESGHGDIMSGKGLLDFEPTLVEVAILHLKKCKLPFEVLDGKRFILNRIRQADWAAIELLKESAATIAGDRQKTEAAIAASVSSDSEYYDTSRYCIPEPPVIDLEARAKATEGGRAKMRETIAQALKNRAS